MKIIILKKITLINFKGIRQQSFQFSPDFNIISGDNATGKTTILDAFLWCLFGKDSTDRKDFEIKTVNADGDVLPRLDHEVELTLLIDAKEVTLRRVLSEKWTKKRGSEEAEFTGNETTYFYNDVPVKMSDYNERINQIIDEGLFKLLTNMAYFHSLHWEKRREIIYSLAGNITDTDILTSGSIEDAVKDKINEIINSGKTFADAKVEANGKKKRIKDELSFIPARIDEAERSKPNPIDSKALQAEIKEIEALKEGKEKEVEILMSDITDSAKVVNEKNAERTALVSEIHAIEARISDIKNQAKSQVQEKKSNIDLEYQKAELANKEIKSKADYLNAEIQRLDEKIQEKRKEWQQANAVQMPEFCGDLNCPMCKQRLPETDIELKKSEFEANFYKAKAEKVARIKQSGVELSERKTKLEDEIKILPEIKEVKRVDFNEAKELDLIISGGETKELITKSLQLNERLSLMAVSTFDDSEIRSKIQAIKSEINELNNRISEIKSSFASTLQIDVLNNRIQELKNREKELSQELASIEDIENCLYIFERAKSDFIEKLINNKFNLVTFRLFETQINGSEIPCCKTLISGVPYSDANNAAKINAGIDIINALINHNDVSAPVFIDNAESINNIMDVSSQLICLKVSMDKELVFSNNN